MMTVEDIKRAISHLSQEDFIDFRTWYEDFKLKFWDKLIDKKAANNQSDQLKESETVYITGETTLYGIVKRVGGEPPTVWIQTLEGNHILCQVDETLAKQLGSLLYTRVGLIGTAKWNVADSSIKSFQITQMTAYQQTPLSYAFSSLSDEIGHYYNDIDVLQWVSTTRKDEY
jgi:hypothetical protein